MQQLEQPPKDFSHRLIEWLAKLRQRVYDSIDSDNFIGTEWDDLTDGGDTVIHKHDRYENIANKDVSGGYVGKTLEKINFWNTARTFMSFLTNAATAVRTYTFPDKDGTVAMTNDKLSAFAATTSAELAGIISDETGSGSVVFSTSPTLVSPILGTPTSGTLDNCTTNTEVAGTNNTHLASTAHVFAERSNTATLTNKTLTGALVTATSADNSATLLVSDNKWVKSQIANTTNQKATSQGVAMTAAASGATGIYAADSAHLAFGTTANYSLVFNGSLPSYTPATTQVLIGKSNNFNNGFNFSIEATTGNMRTRIGANAYSSTVAPSLVAGTSHLFVAVIDWTALTVTFYCDGVMIGTAVSISSSSVTTAHEFSVLGNTTSAIRYAGTALGAYVYNRALSASEVLSLYRNGVAESDKDGSQTAQTSGTLVIGKQYTIDTFVAGDSFTNVGAASNASGVSFIATGTTPTTWTNSSSLRKTGTTLRLEPEGIQLGGWYDSSSNNLNASYPSSGFSFLRQPARLSNKLPTPTAGTGTATLTIAHLLTGIVTDTHATGATATYTLPTATLMDAALPSMQIDDSFEWSLINLSAAAADTATVANGTSHTIVGVAVVQSSHATTGALYGASGRFRTKKSAVNTYITYRIS